MSQYAEWVDDMLTGAKENPSANAVELVGHCGKRCAERYGALQLIPQMKEGAANCKTRTDYVNFFNAGMEAKRKAQAESGEAYDDTDMMQRSRAWFEEVVDGIVMHLGNKECSCDMAEKVHNPMLCNCTLGYNKVLWSEFFGRPVKCELVETCLRDGSDCVVKIYI